MAHGAGTCLSRAQFLAMLFCIAALILFLVFGLHGLGHEGLHTAVTSTLKYRLFLQSHTVRPGLSIGTTTRMASGIFLLG